MSERTVHTPESRGGGPTGIDDIDELGVGAAATVAHGVHSEPLPVGGMTVGEVRRRYADRFDIDPQSDAEIDGQPVTDDAIVGSGQLLMFTRDAGEKGVCCTPLRGVNSRLGGSSNNTQ